MQNLGGNAYQCEEGEEITMTFQPTEPDEIYIEYSDGDGETLQPVLDFELTRRIGSERIDIYVVYKFLPGSTSRCRIFLKGDKGGPQVQDHPPARDLPHTPENRIYSFFP